MYVRVNDLRSTQCTEILVCFCTVELRECRTDFLKNRVQKKCKGIFSTCLRINQYATQSGGREKLKGTGEKK